MAATKHSLFRPDLAVQILPIRGSVCRIPDHTRLAEPMRRLLPPEHASGCKEHGGPTPHNFADILYAITVASAIGPSIQRDGSEATYNQALCNHSSNIEREHA